METEIKIDRNKRGPKVHPRGTLFKLNLSVPLVKSGRRTRREIKFSQIWVPLNSIIVEIFARNVRNALA